MGDTEMPPVLYAWTEYDDDKHHFINHWADYPPQEDHLVYELRKPSDLDADALREALDNTSKIMDDNNYLHTIIQAAQAHLRHIENGG